MPVIRFDPGHSTVLLPAMRDLGTVYAGRRCNIARALALYGAMTAEALGRAVAMHKQTVHDTLNRMVDEGIAFSMSPGGDRRFFLTDRRGWERAILEDDRAPYPVTTPWCVVEEGRPSDEGRRRIRCDGPGKDPSDPGSDGCLGGCDSDDTDRRDAG